MILSQTVIQNIESVNHPMIVRNNIDYTGLLPLIFTLQPLTKWSHHES